MVNKIIMGVQDTLSFYVFADNLYATDGRYFLSADGAKMESVHTDLDVASYATIILQR